MSEIYFNQNNLNNINNFITQLKYNCKETYEYDLNSDITGELNKLGLLILNLKKIYDELKI
jgi:hypothetical protein